MKQAVPLNINIPKPCAQNWEAMAVVDKKGKHCMQCNNIVYDFSEMSDEAMFNFFKTTQSKVCGRFHTSQLQRDILPVPEKISYFKRIHKIAAVLLAIISLRSMPAVASKKQPAAFEVLETNAKDKKIFFSDSAVISGIVKDNNGQPIIGAMVEAGNFRGKAFTNYQGKFTFKADMKNIFSENLYFSYGDLVTAVRTYHIAMGSANYDVVLNNRANGCGIIMGGIRDEVLDIVTLSFKTNLYKLSAGNKAQLAKLALDMKNNPGVSITVNAYPESCGPQHIYFHRVNNIKEHLVKKEGIASERISTNCAVGSGDKNTVEIQQD